MPHCVALRTSLSNSNASMYIGIIAKILLSGTSNNKRDDQNGGNPNMYLAEATCRSAIRAARDVATDLGPAADKVPGLLRIARCSESHSERDTHSVLANKMGLALPVPIHDVPLDASTESELKVLPTIRMRDWARYLVETNNWHRLAGLIRPDPAREQKIWMSFWAHYRALDPGHSIFKLADEGKVQLHRVAAVCLHGDEGRGRRRASYTIISWHSVLGRGAAPAKKTTKRYLKQKTNFTGHPYTTRFILGALTKAMLHEREGVFDALMDATTDDLIYMATEGVKDRDGQPRWLFLLRATGDWPWLSKIAKLDRSFSNCVKKQNQVAGGICHYMSLLRGGNG